MPIPMVPEFAELIFDTPINIPGTAIKYVVPSNFIQLNSYGTTITDDNYTIELLTNGRIKLTTVDYFSTPTAIKIGTIDKTIASKYITNGTALRLFGCDNKGSVDTYYIYICPENSSEVVATSMLDNLSWRYYEEKAVFTWNSSINYDVYIYFCSDLDIYFSPLVKLFNDFDVSFERYLDGIDVVNYRLDPYDEFKTLMDNFTNYHVLDNLSISKGVTTLTYTNYKTNFSAHHEYALFPSMQFSNVESSPYIEYPTSNEERTQYTYLKLLPTFEHLRYINKLLLVEYVESNTTIQDATHLSLSMCTRDSLMITDRTWEDVTLVKKLNDKLQLGTLTTVEKKQWDSNLKGALNPQDLTRIKHGINDILAYSGIRTDIIEESVDVYQHISIRTKSSKNVFKLRTEPGDESAGVEPNSFRFSWANTTKIPLEKSTTSTIQLKFNLSSEWLINAIDYIQVRVNNVTEQVPCDTYSSTCTIEFTYNLNADLSNFIYLDVVFLPDVISSGIEVSELTVTILSNPSTVDTTLIGQKIDNIETNYADFKELDFYLNYVNSVIDYYTQGTSVAIQLPNHPYNTYDKWNTIERILDNAYDMLTADCELSDYVGE